MDELKTTNNELIPTKERISKNTEKRRNNFTPVVGKYLLSAKFSGDF